MSRASVKLVLGSDDDKPVVAALRAHLEQRGHSVVVVPTAAWGPMAREVAERVARGEADFGIVCCFTGTGVSIAANKVAGIRAALCVDADTARGARTWNDANVLALSLRLTTETLAAEIVDAWLSASYAGSEDESLACLGR